jgi:hypothetical protein
MQKKNLKLILSAFEHLSGLKINFHKSELFCFSEALDQAHSYAKLIKVNFQLDIWGIPIHFQRFTNAEWKIMEERLQLRLSSWKGKLLSFEGRLILINSVLCNMVLYMLSFLLLPKGVYNRLDFFRSRFFFKGDSEKKKYRLAK